MEKINKILKEWRTRVNEIYDFNQRETHAFGNITLAITRFKELASFLMKNEPIMRAWCNEYFEKNRAAIFVTWCGKHFRTWADDKVYYGRSHNNYDPMLSIVQEEWDRVYGDSQEMNFSIARQYVMQLSNMTDIRCCDDPTIIAIHTGLEHNYQWDECQYCEEQEMCWRNNRVARMKSSPHPLLNPDRIFGASYRLKDTNKLQDWVLPKRYSTDLYDETQYLKKMETRRITSKPGQTPLQQMKTIMSQALECGGWRLPFMHFFAIRSDKIPEDIYQIFVELWSGLDMIGPSIRLDLPRMLDLLD